MINMKKMEVYVRLIGGVYHSVMANKIADGVIDNMHWLAQDANGDMFLYREKPKVDVEHSEWMNMSSANGSHNNDFNCIGSVPTSEEIPDWQDTLIYVGQ